MSITSVIVLIVFMAIFFPMRANVLATSVVIALLSSGAENSLGVVISLLLFIWALAY